MPNFLHIYSHYRQIALSYFDNQTAILKYTAVYNSLTQK